jgi:hypothetical protein
MCLTSTNYFPGNYCANKPYPAVLLLLGVPDVGQVRRHGFGGVRVLGDGLAVPQRLPLGRGVTVNVPHVRPDRDPVRRVEAAQLAREPERLVRGHRDVDRLPAAAVVVGLDAFVMKLNTVEKCFSGMRLNTDERCFTDTRWSSFGRR